MSSSKNKDIIILIFILLLIIIIIIIILLIIVIIIIIYYYYYYYHYYYYCPLPFRKKKRGYIVFDFPWCSFRDAWFRVCSTCERNSSYSFRPIFLKFYRCFNHNPKIHMWRWSGGAKVSCVSRHRCVQLILAYSWARPAILVAGKRRKGMFLFLWFLYFHSCSSFFPVPLFHLFYYLFCLFSPFLWETTQNDKG